MLRSSPAQGDRSDVPQRDNGLIQNGSTEMKLGIITGALALIGAASLLATPIYAQTAAPAPATRSAAPVPPPPSGASRSLSAAPSPTGVVAPLVQPADNNAYAVA